jgi:staphylococcal nuclease homologue
MNLLKKISLSMLAVIGLASITACGGFDKDKGYTDITSKLKLTKDYDGKNFFDDGIGLVEVRRLTDGDTTTFTLPVPSKDGSSSVVIRYHGIDTPESTIDVQVWGKSASKYNFNRLENAYQIVIEGIYTTSNGVITLSKTNQRYLGYVWYRNSETDEFKNLNLEMVENGYSDSTTPISDYKTYFEQAKDFAKKHKMHIWSNDDDPNYNPNPVATNLEEIVKDINSDDSVLYSRELGVGAQVKFTGTVLDHEQKGSTHYYTVGALGADGLLYKMTLFTGYTNATINSNRYLIIGSTYHIVGAIQYYNDFQISGIKYSVGNTSDDYTHLLDVDNYALFDSKNSNFKEKDETGLHGDLVVESATLENNTLKIVGNALDYKGSTTSQKYTVVVNNVTSYDVNSLTGKSISCGGFKNAAGEIVILSTSDLIIR